MKIIDRKDVPVEQTWNLQDIFENEAAYEQALQEATRMVEDLVRRYADQITPENVHDLLNDWEKFLILEDQVSHYAFLDVETDVNDNKAQTRLQKMMNLAAEWGAKLAFIDAQIAQLPAEALEKAKDECEEHRGYFESLLRNKPYLLSQEVESAMAALSPSLYCAENIYNDIKFGDTQFPNFEVDGKSYELTYNAFENHYESDPDPKVRHAAFEAFSEELKKHENGTAAAYFMKVQQEKLESKLRGYDSVFDMLLLRQNVSRELYDRQIDIIMEELAPAMRRYAALLKRVHGIEKMTSADLKIEIDPDYSPRMEYDQTRDAILEGLSVLGEEYQQILRRAFDERWIDYSENRGKRTGAFCAAPAKVHPYVLLSFNHHMSEVMTLAHELGHAGADIYTEENQSLYNSRWSMYIVEAPSTTNEIIMENYLLKKAGDDKRQRRWVLSQMVSKTYYHNFVTHLLEAAYQREVYQRIDAGEPVRAEDLNAIFRDVLQRFWGDDVEILEGSTRTWMRQPHYYMGLYPYTYSAGLTIGTQMAHRILNEGDHVAQEWLEVLKAGGSLSPVEQAKKAGVDITTDKPLRDTIAYIASLIDEMVALTEEIEKEQ